VTAVGDEGGFAPRLASNESALEYVCARSRRRAIKPGEDISLALDAALSEFYDSERPSATPSTRAPEDARGDRRDLRRAGARVPDRDVIEDGCAEDDDKGWKLLTRALGKKVQLVGDDLFVTSPARLAKGIERRHRNSILIKLNQIGTVTETLDCIRVGQRGRLPLDHLAPLGRDRGHLHRRPRRRDQRRPDQDRLGLALRSRGQVQPAPRASRGLQRQGPLQALSARRLA
jgi:enolase